MPTIDSLGGTQPATQPGAGSALGGLDGDAFLKLLVAQLRYQNPMSPSDPSAMLEQTAQFTQVETLQKIARTQQLLMGLEHANVAAQLAGKEVTARDANGAEVTGVVDAVRFTSAGPMLVLGDRELPLGAAVEVRPGPAR